MTNIEYQIGDTIEYMTFAESYREVVVTGKHMEKGKPGFDGVLTVPAAYPSVWGYDYQVVRVVKRA
jgi:hypothetical protein